MEANIEPVSSASSASDLPTAPHPSIPQAWVLDGELVVRPGAAGDDATPIRVGFLSDMPSGSGVVGFLDPIMLAFEDAMRDHRGYRGDFMFMKQLRDGKFHFVSYHWPQWSINHTS